MKWNLRLGGCVCKKEWSVWLEVKLDSIIRIERLNVFVIYFDGVVEKIFFNLVGCNVLFWKIRVVCV